MVMLWKHQYCRIGGCSGGHFLNFVRSVIYCDSLLMMWYMYSMLSYCNIPEFQDIVSLQKHGHFESIIYRNNFHIIGQWWNTTIICNVHCRKWCEYRIKFVSYNYVNLVKNNVFLFFCIILLYIKTTKYIIVI